MLMWLISNGETMKTTIFLDQATSYHPLRSVLDVLKKTIHPHCLSSLFQNKEIFLQFEKGKEAVHSYFDSKKDSIFSFTAGGKQAIAEALDLHYHKEMFHSGKQHILVPKADKGLFTQHLEKFKALGVVYDYLESNLQGHITAEILLNAITPRTSLVMLSWANPLTGVIQPIEDLVKICHEKGVSCLVDASHVIGSLYFSLADMNIDYTTFDAKSFHGPYQVGGLFIQNQNWRVDTEDIFPLQLEALDIALSHAKDSIDTMHLEIARLRNTFEKQILEKIPSARVFFQDAERLPNISVIAFPYVASEYFLYLLAQDRLYASMGGDGQALLETLLSNRGVDPFLAKCALSFSLSHLTTQEEMEEALERICKHYTKAKELFSEGV